MGDGACVRDETHLPSAGGGQNPLRSLQGHGLGEPPEAVKDGKSSTGGGGVQRLAVDGRATTSNEASVLASA